MALVVAFLAAMLQLMPVGLKTLDRGAQSNVREGRQVVVRTDSEWARLWQEHAGERQRPAVNFATDMVLGVFMGNRPTAGYRVEILSATPRDGTLVVRYQELTPGRDAMTAQILTAAYQLVAVPSRPGEVTFEKVEPQK